jgi:hypothetical protein
VKRALTVAAAVAALLSAAPVAQAAPSPDKELCKSGGFANYVDPTTDLPFKNQGRCVSFVNGGGILIPVEDEPPVAIFPTVKLSLGEFADGTFPVIVEAQGSPNTAYDLIVGAEAGTATTNADGLATFTVYAQPETTLAVTYQGQEIGSIAIPAAPVVGPAETELVSITPVLTQYENWYDVRVELTAEPNTVHRVELAVDQGPGGVFPISGSDVTTDNAGRGVGVAGQVAGGAGTYEVLIDGVRVGSIRIPSPY